MKAPIDVLASVSLVTRTADLVIEVRKILFDFKNNLESFHLPKNKSNPQKKICFTPFQTKSALTFMTSQCKQPL